MESTRTWFVAANCGQGSDRRRGGGRPDHLGRARLNPPAPCLSPRPGCWAGRPSIDSNGCRCGCGGRAGQEGEHDLNGRGGQHEGRQLRQGLKHDPADSPAIPEARIAPVEAPLAATPTTRPAAPARCLRSAGPREANRPDRPCAPRSAPPVDRRKFWRLRECANR